MSGFKTQHIIFLVSLALLASSVPSRARILERWTIHIVNSLSGNRTLFAHCKSKDDDLGPRNLTSSTYEFHWSFRVNIMGTTLFYCYLRTDQQQYAAFDVFWAEERHDWLRVRCSHDHSRKDCVWSAYDDGIYLNNLAGDSYHQELIHEWGTHW